jgi:hypothetical protein
MEKHADYLCEQKKNNTRRKSKGWKIEYDIFRLATKKDFKQIFAFFDEPANIFSIHYVGRR